MKKFYTLAIAFVAVIGLALLAAPAEAVHKGAGPLTCGGCHTMHNSQGGASMGGIAGGTAILLRGTAANHNFCLRCHAADGPDSGLGAPKVLTLLGEWTSGNPFAFTAATTRGIGAGGDFQRVCGNIAAGVWNCSNENGTEAAAGNALGRGHSLGAGAGITPPGGTLALTAEFRCTNCHDPHGTDIDTHASINRFRNLKFSPSDSGGPAAGTSTDLNVSIAGGEYAYGWKGSTSTLPTATMFTTLAINDGSGVWPIADGAPTNSTDSNQYTATGAGNGISAFCASCHDNWHEVVATGNITGNDWARHPVAAIVNAADTSGSGTLTIDWGNYTNVNLLYRVPMAQGGGFASTNMFFGDTNNQDRVFCLSCHFAHGGPYYDNLRWEHFTAVIAGGGTPAAIATSVGCQQCHNR